jgi:acetylornithine deacetylase/succinyl-diaminopimelate desuccinylase-like protein
VTDLRAAVAADADRLRSDLERLVRVPSIAFDGYPDAPNAAAAELTAELLREAGVEDVRLLEVPGAPPTVLAKVPPPPGAPTVLLYAHYDVQPPGPEDAWTSPAWEPTVRDGRLYGRGAADDKSGIAMHLGALRAFGGRPPVGVTVVIEGDEETGRGTFEAWARAHPEELAADVVVVADGGNWKLGEPTLIASLRGLCECFVEVRTLRAPAHSGLVGGAAPDAMLTLIRVLDSLVDEHGDVAVEGLRAFAWEGLPMPEDALRSTAGVLDGVPLVGTGPIADRLYTRPAVTVIGIDATPVASAPNAVVPEARAKVSMRLAPGEDPDRAFELVAAHLRAAAPWGIEVDVTPGAGAPGWLLEGDHPALAAAGAALADAYGKEAVTVGTGGAIPLVTVLAELLPGAGVVLWGAQDDGARIHAGDESVDLAELERATAAEALLLARLAEAAGA